MAYLDNLTYVLNIQPGSVPVPVHLSQNENGRRLYFTISGNESAFPSGTSVTISGTKPDGVVYSASGSLTNGVVLINEDTQMTAVAGTWDAKIKLISSGQTVATGRVRFIIDEDTVAPGSVPSDSQLEGLVAEAQYYAEEAREESFGSPLVASTAAGMADHNRVYVYTGSESGYTAGHWYYWNGSAWADGGIYNSVAVNTDDTLSLVGVAADAKAVGDALVPDTTLTQSGKIADAKVVGDELSDIKSDLEAIVPGLTDEAKDALLDCFAHVAWADEHGQEYYDALYEVLYGEPVPEPDVPEGYTKYDWIHVENATTQGGDTYIKRNDQIFIPITGDKNTYKYNILATITNSNEACIMGGRDTAGGTDGTAIYMKNNGANIAIHCHGADSGYMSVSGISQTGIRNIVFNPIANPATISVDGVLNTFAWTSQSQQTDAEIALFANPAPNASYLAYNPNKNLQIGRIKVYDSSEELVCDLIPCSDPNGKYGMYDKVGETFLTSNTANTYSCGNWE